MSKYTPKYNTATVKTDCSTKESKDTEQQEREPTIIVTGWTDPKKVEAELRGYEQRYFAIGNLYSPTPGIENLLRNILYNFNTVRRVIFFDNTDLNNVGVRGLVHFFYRGFTDNDNPEYWEIRTDETIKALISKHIPKEALELIRSHIDFEHITRYPDLRHSLKTYTPIYRKNAEDFKPMIFPETVVNAIVKRGSSNGHLIVGNTTQLAWLDVLHRIRTQGYNYPTGYGGSVQGLNNVTTVITGEGLEPSHEFNGYDLPDYVPTNVDHLTNYIRLLLEDIKETDSVKYTYGSRIRSHFGRDQIIDVINKLKAEKVAASAVINLWDSSYDNVHSGSPCLNHIQIQVDDQDRLHLSSLFRSQDAFTAFVPNLLALRSLQVLIHKELLDTYPELKVGDLTNTVRWLHIYEDSFRYADEVLQEKRKAVKKVFADPVGNFVCDLVDSNVETTTRQQLEVTHYTIAGLTVKTYLGFNARHIMADILLDNPNLEPSHIAYLAMELLKAEQASKSHSTYRMS